MSEVQSSKDIAKALDNAADELAKNASEYPEEFTGDKGKCVRDFCNAAQAIANLIRKGESAKLLLQPLLMYETLLPFYLVMQSIFKYINEIMAVDVEQHSKKIVAIKQRLEEVGKKVSEIAEQIKQLQKIMTQNIIHGDVSKKEDFLQEFDLKFDMTCNTLNNCLDRMAIIRDEIDEGLASTDEFKARIAASMTVGIGTSAAITSIASLSAALGPLAPVGITVVSAVIVGITVYYCVFNPTEEQQKSRNDIRDAYKEQKRSWQTLKADLKELKRHLAAMERKRNNARK